MLIRIVMLNTSRDILPHSIHATSSYMGKNTLEHTQRTSHYNYCVPYLLAFNHTTTSLGLARWKRSHEGHPSLFKTQKVECSLVHALQSAQHQFILKDPLYASLSAW